VRLDLACSPAFARHETFHPRYGWVKKGLDASILDPDLLNQDEAVVELGVGRNMVKSIRHWGMAFKVLSQVKLKASRSTLTVPTNIGELMFSDQGWDPYCEVPGTLWLLHWWLLAPRSIAPVWWLAFNEFPGVEFTDQDLEQFVQDRVQGWSAPNISAIKKDVSCLLRMYSPASSARSTFDDAIDCPFRDLELVTASTVSPGGYRFLMGAKPTLPPSVAAFICLDFISRTERSGNTVTVSSLAAEPGAPGRALKLTEPALIDLLERAALQHTEIELTSLAGVSQLSFEGDSAIAATEILYDYYRSVLSKARFHGTGVLGGPLGDGPYPQWAKQGIDD
jgi:hypothetical protein